MHNIQLVSLKALYFSHSLFVSPFFHSPSHTDMHMKYHTLNMMDLYIRDRGTQTIPWGDMMYLTEQKV